MDVVAGPALEPLVPNPEAGQESLKSGRSGINNALSMIAADRQGEIASTTVSSNNAAGNGTMDAPASTGTSNPTVITTAAKHPESTNNVTFAAANTGSTAGKSGSIATTSPVETADAAKINGVGAAAGFGEGGAGNGGARNQRGFNAGTIVAGGAAIDGPHGNRAGGPVGGPGTSPNDSLNSNQNSGGSLVEGEGIDSAGAAANPKSIFGIIHRGYLRLGTDQGT